MNAPPYVWRDHPYEDFRFHHVQDVELQPFDWFVPGPFLDEWETPKAPKKGNGLQVEQISGVAIARDTESTPNAWALMPHGVAERVHVRRGYDQQFPLGERFRMPIRFVAVFDGAFKPEALTDHCCYLSRRGPEPVYYPPPQDQRDLYGSSGPMRDWYTVMDAIRFAWRFYTSGGAFIAGSDASAIQAVIDYHGWRAFDDCDRDGRPGWYCFWEFAGRSIVLTSEQVQRAVRWYTMPHTVNLS